MKLKVKSIKLESNGVLLIETNISENLELAKHVSKDKIEKCLNDHLLEMHIYQDEFMVSSITYKGKSVLFTFEELQEFIFKKHKEDN